MAFRDHHTGKLRDRGVSIGRTLSTSLVGDMNGNLYMNPICSDSPRPSSAGTSRRCGSAPGEFRTTMHRTTFTNLSHHKDMLRPARTVYDAEREAGWRRAALDPVPFGGSASEKTHSFVDKSMHREALRPARTFYDDKRDQEEMRGTALLSTMGPPSLKTGNSTQRAAFTDPSQMRAMCVPPRSCNDEARDFNRERVLAATKPDKRRTMRREHFRDFSKLTRYSKPPGTFMDVRKAGDERVALKGDGPFRATSLQRESYTDLTSPSRHRDSSGRASTTRRSAICGDSSGPA